MSDLGFVLACCYGGFTLCFAISHGPLHFQILILLQAMNGVLNSPLGLENTSYGLDSGPEVDTVWPDEIVHGYSSSDLLRVCLPRQISVCLDLLAFVFVCSLGMKGNGLSLMWKIKNIKGI